jgi:NAD-dependent SIR2 family protein deacetylase
LPTGRGGDEVFPLQGALEQLRDAHPDCELSVTFAIPESLAIRLANAEYVLVLVGEDLACAGELSRGCDSATLPLDFEALRGLGMDSPAPPTEELRERAIGVLRRLEGTRPGAAYDALAKFQRRKPGAVLATDSIDGLLERSGARDVLEFSGSAARLHCLACGAVTRGSYPQPCPACGAGPERVRLDIGRRSSASTTAMFARGWAAAEKAEVLLVIGACARDGFCGELSSVAFKNHAQIVEVVPEQTGFSFLSSVTLCGDPHHMLPLFFAAIPDSGPTLAYDQRWSA